MCDKTHTLNGLARRMQRKETMETLRELTENVRITVTPGVKNYRDLDAWQLDAHKYTVTLRYQRRRMTVPFFMGSGHTAPPTAHDVMETLLSDAGCAVDDFTGFCGNLGYDPDSRRAERIYRQCVRIGRNLRVFLGDDFARFDAAER